MINKVQLSGVNTSKLPVLSAKEKQALFEKIKKGDKKAREEFINGNLRLVLSIIGRFSSRGENPDDLFQVGCVGLIKALDNFDTEQGVQFSTYAVPMIIGEIRSYLLDYNSIRVSRSVRDTAYRALQVKERLVALYGKEPTIEQIAKELEKPKEEIVFALDAICEPVSLFEPVYHDGGDTVFIMDQLSDEKSDEAWIEHIVLKEAMEHLSNKERQILDLRFFRGRTQTEVAEEVGISQAQVSRLEKSAIKHMRKYV
ncbi:MAG: RNA polymerase sporulation sigma factor SigG [Clostridia bacterium]|nr:RNA polymerase sporulation sigma factor SigG [Clostridia bacterium]